MGERPDEIEFQDPRAAGNEGVSEREGWDAGTLAGTETPATDVTAGYPGEPPNTASDSAAADEIGASRAHIEQTRSNMSETIDAIQEKLSPSNLVQQAKETVKDATIGKATNVISNAGNAVGDAVTTTGDRAKGFGSTVVETIRQNPVPAALAGLGLGWLVMSGRKHSSDTSAYQSRSQDRPSGYKRQYDYGYPSRYEGQPPPSSTIGEAARGAQNTVGQAADTAGQVASQARDAAGQAVGQVQDTAAQLGMQAQYQAQRAASGFQEMIEERPLAVAAGAVALGLAIGLSIPTTPQENRLMGETRDSLVDQAQQTVQETAQKVQSVAQEAVGAAKEEAQQQFSDS